MESVSDVLVKLGFPELIPVFNDHEINMEAFRNLSKEAISELIPKIGPRTMFLTKYNIYLKESKESSESSVNSEDSFGEIDEELHIEYFPDADVGLTEEQRKNTPGELHRKEENKKCAEKLKIREILTSTPKGKSLITLYEKNNKLTDHERNILVQIIIEHELREDVNRRLPSAHLEAWASAILDVFPTETKGIYFCTRISRSGEKYIKVGGGKLITKYYNYRRNLKNALLLPRKRKYSPSPSSSLYAYKVKQTEKIKFCTSKNIFHFTLCLKCTGADGNLYVIQKNF